MNASEKAEPLRYEVHRLTETMSIDGVWDKPQWRGVKPIEIKNHMGSKPEYQPVTQAKALYDDENIYVIFRVEDQYVRAVAKEYHGPVWKDSCVELFFTPGEDLSPGYFNLETNCGGTALFHYQKSPGKDMRYCSYGYELLGHIILDNDTWWQEYYSPLEKLIKGTIEWRSDNVKITKLVDSDRREVEMFKENPEVNSSVIFVMKRND